MKQGSARERGRVRWWVALTALILCLAPLPRSQAGPVRLFLDEESPPAVFASDEIRTVLEARRHAVRRQPLAELPRRASDRSIVLATTSNTTVLALLESAGGAPPEAEERESYSLRATGAGQSATWWVLGGDAVGVMYGGLELAEVVRLEGLTGVTAVEHRPYMTLRGTKFNIPLDVRTPSYSDVSDAAQHNIAEMWSFDFWREYIDQLARYRFNFVSLWNLHPFPSLVRVPEYPDVALADVKRSRVRWKEHYSLNGRGFDDPEILRDLETLKMMAIDEKIDFWRRVMRYGRDRGVDFYFVTWNIFVYGTEGKYGITDAIDNETTADYFRRSVREMFRTYPDLRGIGLTTGENMPGSSLEEKEDWAFETFGRGVLDAAEEQPGRGITFIHRQHQTGARNIARKFAPLIEHDDIDFIFSFKYAKAHVYSSTVQPYHRDFVEEIGSLETIWTLRNDDVYRHRWGAPDFVREFIRNIPREVSRGFYFGSDQYIWGREFMSTEPEAPRQLEIVKHWYQWMLWGRLGYDPDVLNVRFIQLLQARFPGVSGAALFAAWQEASMVYPKTTGFHWGALDFQWYIEASKSRPGPAGTPTGFHDVERFISLRPHPGTDYISIPEYVKDVSAARGRPGTTPIEVADEIHGHADAALRILDGLSPRGDKELRLTLGDLRAVACMGKYYAHKIRGATELALFRETNGHHHQEVAIRELTRAAEFWRRYVATALSQYESPLWTNRVGICDWRELMRHVLGDIERAGGTPRLRSMAPTPGGAVLEAEAAHASGMEKRATCAGATGSEYLEVGSSEGGWVEWTFDAPRAGTYLLEVRYALDEGQHRSPLEVNGVEVDPLVLWTTGGECTWGWDRVPVSLREGPNAIRLTPGARRALIDHLNVLSTDGLD